MAAGTLSAASRQASRRCPLARLRTLQSAAQSVRSRLLPRPPRGDTGAAALVSLTVSLTVIQRVQVGGQSGCRDLEGGSCLLCVCCLQTSMYRQVDAEDDACEEGAGLLDNKQQLRDHQLELQEHRSATANHNPSFSNVQLPPTSNVKPETPKKAAGLWRWEGPYSTHAVRRLRRTDDGAAGLSPEVERVLAVATATTKAAAAVAAASSSPSSSPPCKPSAASPTAQRSCSPSAPPRLPRSNMTCQPLQSKAVDKGDKRLPASSTRLYLKPRDKVPNS